jgi:uncharacterized protein YfiM (DUF2279 family)
MKKLLFVLLLIVPTLVMAGNPVPDASFNPEAKYWHFRWANDTWGKHTSYFGSESHYSWTDHAVGSYSLFQYMKHNRKMSNKKAFLWTFGLGVAWEIKDSAIPWEKAGKFGGEGLSWKDCCRDLTGITSAILFNWVTEKRQKNHILHK